MKKEPEKTSGELRKFGIVMTVAFAVLACLLVWRQKPSWPIFMAISAAFLLASLAFPGILSPVEKAWMKLAIILAFIMTRVILFIAYFIVFTPLGLVMRISGKKPLITDLDGRASSYWESVPREAEPEKRYNKPF